MKYQLMTIAQLAECIASQLDYSKIWESKFPDCDFVTVDVEMRQYSNEELEDMHRDACGWFGIKKLPNIFDSTTLFAFADHWGGGCDKLGRLYDGIGVLEAEIVLQDVIRGALEDTETVMDETILLVEFLNTEDQDAPDSEKIFFIPIEGAQKIIQDYNARQETHREEVPAEYLHAFMAKERDGSWTAIDNRDGNCWTENFKSMDVAKRWLLDKIDTDEAHAEDNAPAQKPEKVRTVLELINQGIPRDHMTEAEERAFVAYWFDEYERVGFCKTFDTPYESQAKYKGQTFSYLARCDEENRDLETLPAWRIRLECGDEIEAYPEEICKAERGCRICGGKLKYTANAEAGLYHWHCTVCGASNEETIRPERTDRTLPLAQGLPWPESCVASFMDDVLIAVNEKKLEGEYATWSDFCVELPVPAEMADGCTLRVWGDLNDAEERIYSVRIDMVGFSATIYSSNATDELLSCTVMRALERLAQNHGTTSERIVNAICQKGICPVCGSEFNYTGDEEDMDNGGVNSWKCKHCGAYGDEGYNEVFDGRHYNVHDKKGDEITVLSPKYGPFNLSRKDIVVAVCQEGICPVCGGQFEYTGKKECMEFGGVNSWKCPHCGTHGDEGFDKVFDGQHYNVYDADGHEITILPPVGTPVPDDDLLCEAGDEIDNAVFDAICAMTVKKPEWDMSIIGEVEDAIEEILKRHNIPVCRPWENEDGHICHSIPEERCKHCPRHAAVV